MSDATTWDAVRDDDRRLGDGVAAILARHGLPKVPCDRFSTGSLPVYAVGDRAVLKLFPPHEAEFQQTEAAALAHVEGRLSIPTPRLIAMDVFDGWPYVLMSRCAGTPMRDAWSEIGPDARRTLMAAVGQGMADLHALDLPEPTVTLSPSLGSWSTYLAEQARTATERQRSRGLGAPWLPRIEPFVSAVDFGPAPGEPLVLLHTEWMREHVLVEQIGDDWRATGLIDFEPAMRGPAGYELASVGLFVTEGDPALFGAVLSAYGRESRRGEALARRCLGYALIHRYCNLPWFLERNPPPPGVSTLEGLAMHWFGT